MSGDGFLRSRALVTPSTVLETVHRSDGGCRTPPPRSHTSATTALTVIRPAGAGRAADTSALRSQHGCTTWMPTTAAPRAQSVKVKLSVEMSSVNGIRVHTRSFSLSEGRGPRPGWSRPVHTSGAPTGFSPAAQLAWAYGRCL